MGEDRPGCPGGRGAARWRRCAAHRAPLLSEGPVQVVPPPGGPALLLRSDMRHGIWARCHHACGACSARRCGLLLLHAGRSVLTPVLVETA